MKNFAATDKIWSVESDETFWGPWPHFTASWWAERDRANVMFLRFEDMKAQPLDTITRIARFLDVPLTRQQVQLVAEVTSFAAMKKMDRKFYPVRQTIWSAPTGQIIRKGAIGDGDSLFSTDAISEFRSAMSSGLRRAGSNFPFYGFSRHCGEARA